MTSNHVAITFLPKKIDSPRLFQKVGRRLDRLPEDEVARDDDDGGNVEADGDVVVFWVHAAVGDEIAGP